MNRRGEWGQNLPPKLEVVDPDEDFRPQEEKKTKRKPNSQSPATKDDPGSQKMKRQKVETPSGEQSDRDKKQTDQTDDRARAKPKTSGFDGFEEGGAVTALSWDAIRSQNRNKSILQFFSKQGNPSATDFGENSGVLGLNGGQKGQGDDDELS